MPVELKFKLERSHLRGRTDYKPKMCPRDSVTLDEIGRRDRVARYRTRPEMLMADFDLAMELLLEEAATTGRIVHAGDRFSIQANVRGGFAEPREAFDPRRHRIELVLKPGRRLKRFKTPLKPKNVTQP